MLGMPALYRKAAGVFVFVTDHFIVFPDFAVIFLGLSSFYFCLLSSLVKVSDAGLCTHLSVPPITQPNYSSSNLSWLLRH